MKKEGFWDVNLLLNYKKEVNIKMSYNDFNCKICSTHVTYASPAQNARELCEKHMIEIEQKERKTYGWIFYHLFKFKKQFGKIILPDEECSENKYGLQRILVNRINNIITFEFYFGRSFIHRPILIVDLNKLEKNKQLIYNTIKKANQMKYLDTSFFQKTTSYYKRQEAFKLKKRG